MKEETFTSILWLSDIHFRGEYLEKASDYEGSLEPFLHSFLKLIREKYNNTIKTVILTGDLAFKGSKSDYRALDKKLVAPLKEILGDQVNFIAIPGNHDVERRGVEVIFDKIKTDRKELNQVFKDYSNKTKLLNTYTKDYKNLFNDYTSYLKRANINSDINSDKDRLFGYITDSSNKIIYFLFNTAWFCLSASIKTIGINEILNNVGKLENMSDKETEEIKNNIERLFELYAYTNENGGQLIGSQLIADADFFLEEIQSLKFHEYTKITLLHHPFSWLSWEEMYNFEGGDNSFLRTIVRNSDLILTGHEHVPEYIVPSLIFDRSWQIPAGMFLDDNIKLDKSNAENFPHNRFSLLNIYSDRAEEVKYLYQSDINEWKLREPKILPFHRKYKYIFDNIDLFTQKKESFLYPPTFVIDFFKANKGINLRETSPRDHSNSELEIIDTYDEEGDDTYWIVIRPKVANYYQKELVAFDTDSSHHLDKRLIDLLKKSAAKSVCIVFLTLDLLVSSQKYDISKSTQLAKWADVSTQRSHEEVREQLFGEITNEADLHFDRYRHHFFNRPNGLPFDKISSLNFINVVIPYWKLGE